MERLGYSHLIEFFSLSVLEQPVQCFLHAGSVLTREVTSTGVEIHYPRRFRTNGSWQSHLLFAIKHEGVNLEVLKALFQRIDMQDMSALVSASPHSVYVRRLWFLYEFLTEHELSVPPLKTGNFDYVLPPEEYFCLDKAHSWNARRQRLVCNLPGNAVFCPIVRMTPCIREYLQKDLASRVTEAISGYSAELLYRASDFLYLKETKSSYAIERQTPSQKRTAAFMGILREAGKERLTKSLLLRLQNAIVDERYAEKDYRDDQVYVGQTLAPGRELVHFIGLKPNDLKQFMEAYLETAGRLINSSCDAVICAAVLSFAFVFIHPFDDGNGRITRALTDMLLARSEQCRKRFYCISAEIKVMQKGYYDVLEKTQRGNGDITEWLLWFLRCFEQALDATENTVATVMRKVAFWECHRNVIFNERQRKMLNLLFDNFFGKLTSSKWAKITKCSSDTALNDIKDLIGKGILTKTAEGGRSTNYILVESNP